MIKQHLVFGNAFLGTKIGVAIKRKGAMFAENTVVQCENPDN